VRVLLVNSHGADSTYGGAERYADALGTGLEARGHEVQVLSAFPVGDGWGPRTTVLHRSDWRDSRIRRLRNHIGDVVAAPWPRLGAALETAAPDLVHTNNLPGIATGIWESARRLGIPVVHTLHDYQLLCPRTSLTKRDGRPCHPSPFLCGARTGRLVRWAGGVRTVIGVSEHILRRHAGLFPGSAERVVRPPLAPLGDRPVVPPRTPLTTLGYLGALTEVKGVRILLAAAPSLVAQGVEVRIAGDGPLRAEVEASDAVRYVGRIARADLGAFIAGCDAGVVPSLWDEPGPLVVGEWLSGGRPVLATRRGGLAEAAERGGVVSFDESTPALVDAVARLRQDGEWRRVLATVPAVEGDADIQRWLEAHVEAYETALAAQSAS
jgi:glycosyltransferase involved in cell wall biosynthesis